MRGDPKHMSEESPDFRRYGKGWVLYPASPVERGPEKAEEEAHRGDTLLWLLSLAGLLFLTAFANHFAPLQRWSPVASACSWHGLLPVRELRAGVTFFVFNPFPHVHLTLPPPPHTQK